MFDALDLIKRTNVEARPYQLRIVKKVVDLYEEKHLRSILIESATGSGKTVMALAIAKAMHERSGMKIGWVAMRKHLLHQVSEENRAKGFNVPMHVMSMFSKEVPANLDMLIVDEAQHDATGSMAHIHATVQPKFILGMSATPFRADRVKLCFDSVVKDSGIATLIKDGYLSQYHHYIIKDWSVENVIRHYMMDINRWGKTVMFFHRLAHCDDAVKRLISNGIKAEVVDGASDTDTQLDDFRNDRLQVLVNCMKLTEGMDIPSIKTVFCRPSCKPVTIQMAGRALRKHPDHPYKQIVQSEDTPYSFAKTALAKLQHLYVDNEWRTLEINPHIDMVNKRVIRALANTETALPDYLVKAKKRVFGGRRRDD